MSVTFSTKTPCEICQGVQFTPVADTDRDGKPLPTVICEGCGHVFTHPRPTTEEIERYYREEYRVSYKQAVQPKPKHTYRAGRCATERLSYLNPLLTPGCLVLDMGSGGGEMLYMLRAAGYAVQGIEPNEGYARYARDTLNLPIHIGGYKDAPIASESMDVIVSFHVVEHLERPVEALRKMAEWLRPGGRMLIEVPNIDSTCQWPRSRFHFAHLQNFSPPTLALAGERAGLVADRTFTSADGGNVVAIFTKPAQPKVISDAHIPGNAEKVKRVLFGHTTLRHCFSLAPYLRPFQRLARRFAETVALRDNPTGPQLLESCAEAWKLRHAGDTAPDTHSGVGKIDAKRPTVAVQSHLIEDV